MTALKPMRSRREGTGRFAVALAALVWVASTSTGARADRIERALRDAASKAVDSLKDSIAANPDKFAGIDQLAVVRVKGDVRGGRIAELLVVEATDTPFGVVEIVDMEELLEGVKFETMDYEWLFERFQDQAAQIGGFLPSQAYLMGRMVAAEQFPLVVKVTLTAKLVNLASRQVVWAANVEGEEWAPSNTLLITAIAILAIAILIVLLKIAASGRPKDTGAIENKEAEALLEHENNLRMSLGSEISRAQTHINQGRQHAAESSRRELADRMRDVDNRLSTLKGMVQRTTFGAGPSTKPKPAGMRRLGDFVRSTTDDFRVITSRCEGVASALIDNGQRDVEKDLDRIEKDMTNFENRFRDRRDYLKGLL